MDVVLHRAGPQVEFGVRLESQPHPFAHDVVALEFGGGTAVLLNGPPQLVPGLRLGLAEHTFLDTFGLSASATEKCKSRAATHEQDSNALFFQTMCVLRGDGFAEPADGTLIPDLSDAIFYMDFDRSSAKKTAAPAGESPGHVPLRWRGTGLRFRRRRIMLGMDIDRCQLSKLYAYNGLMLSSGRASTA